MSERLFNRAFALFVATVLIAPAAFMAYAPPAKAIVAEVVSDTSSTSLEQLFNQVKTNLSTAYSAVKDAITAVSSVTSAAKEAALVIERYVLQPLAYLTTGNLLKKITSSILGFVGGKNALGKPLYVQDLRAYIQNVGDIEAFTFLSQYQSNSNSIFKSAIASSLRANYLQGSSLAGFFAANKSTLASVSSNPQAYVAGNWRMGGWAAWLGLTTVDQNNPYLDRYLVGDQFERQRQTAMAARLAKVNQNQGFLDWCGAAGGTTAGGGGTTYDASGNPVDVTSTDEFKTTTGDATLGDTPDDIKNTSFSCRTGEVQAGDVCGIPGSPDAPGSYDLPIGYSCASGSQFNSSFGGCENPSNGEFSAPIDAKGNPVNVDAGVDTSPQTSTEKLTDRTSGSAGTAVQAVDALTANAHGVDNFDHNCWRNVRSNLCDAYGGGSSFCTPQGQNSTGVLRNAGWTSVATLDGASSNSGISPNLAKGDVVQVYDSSGGNPLHVCQWNGSNCVDGTIQTNIIPYSGLRASGGATVKVWRAPGKTSVSSTNTRVAIARTGSTGRVLAASTGSLTSSGGSSGLKPGDPCTKSDGTSGKVQTPGSIIKEYLSNALKATSLDKLIAGAGDLSTQVSKIIGDVGAVMKTVDVATNLFGGSSSGLQGFSGNSSYTSPFAGYLDSPGYMGLTSASVYANANSSGATATDLATRIADYQNAWSKIGGAADAANTTLRKLVNTCPAQSGTAQSALNTYVTPLESEYAGAKATIQAANDLIAKTNADVNSTSDNSAYTNDIQLQQTAAPTATDVANIEARAQTDGQTKANPAGSLNISGGSIIDQMNMLRVNGAAQLTNTTYCPVITADTSSSPSSTAPPSSTTSTTDTTTNTNTVNQTSNSSDGGQ